VTYIKIITSRPGIKTSEKILQIIKDRETGITIRQLSEMINRPVSMLQVCLNQLTLSKQISAKQSKVSRNLIYYPRSN
jgi:predicted transcriptional regulator